MLPVLTVPLVFLAVSALLLLALHLEGVLTGRRRSWGGLAKQYAWCMGLLLVLVLLVRRLHGRSVPDAADLTGVYRIDRASWPGPQAEWQFAQYTWRLIPQAGCSLPNVTIAEAAKPSRPTLPGGRLTVPHASPSLLLRNAATISWRVIPYCTAALSPTATYFAPPGTATYSFAPRAGTSKRDDDRG